MSTNDILSEKMMNEPKTFSLIEPLTEREIDILRLMAEGLSNPEIAERLVLGTETVRWYTKQIYGKLGVHSRTQASMRARDLGLLEGDDLPAPARAPLVAPAGVVHLPTYTTPFIGREEERADLIALLEDPATRLVTVVGPGGVGKTRLSVEVARAQASAFPDGVTFIPLLNVKSADDLNLTAAHHLNLRLKDSGSARADLLHHLSQRRLLLVMDNFESVVNNGVDLVTEILREAPNVKLLISSQVSLNLREEWVRQIDGMTVPDDDDEPLETYSAVQLFVERVRRVRRDFDLEENRACVLQICRLVEGVPLAIELAAAWLRTLTCEDVAREIQRNVDFLASNQRDVEERHRSIRAVFEYAWNLLTDEEQKVFRRLSVFQGGFGRSAAEQVAGASIQVLSELVSKSLLQQNEEGLFEIHGLLRRHAEHKLETLDASKRSTRTTTLMGWLTLLKGNFEKLREFAENSLEDTLDGSSQIDKAFVLAALGILAGIDEDYARCQQLSEASQAQLLGSNISGLFAYLGLAIANCGFEDYAAAHRNIHIALQQMAELRIPAFILLCLPVTAVVLAYEAEPEEATELYSLAFNHPTSTIGWMESWPLLRRLREDLLTELGEEDFFAAWERGKERNPETVVAELLARR
ncbi:MAG: LuxR C-terminal-related transcriptional regulator [bacterium]|nr:LuxR C-terminal-related transcriptional regulator [bacterium]